MKKMLVTALLFLAVGCSSDTITLPDHKDLIDANAARLDLLEAKDAVQDARLDALELNLSDLEVYVDDQIDTLNSKIADDIAELDDRISGRLDLNERAISKIKRRVRSLQRQVWGLQRGLRSLRRLVSNLNRKYSRLSFRLSRLSDDVEDLEDDLGDLEGDVEDNTEAIQELLENAPECYVEFRNIHTHGRRYRTVYADVYMVCGSNESRLRSHTRLQRMIDDDSSEDRSR